MSIEKQIGISALFAELRLMSIEKQDGVSVLFEGLRCYYE